MDSETLKIFITETETFLPMIRNGILVCSQEGNNGGELETSLLYSQAVCDAAASIGLADIASTGEKLAQEIRSSLGSTGRLSDVETRRLLDALAILEASVAKLQFSGEEFNANLESFVDRSFVNLGFETSEEPVSETADDSFEQEEFEIDEEMLEIFAEEAEQLLASMNSQLEILKSEPNNRESLLEIRRNAHTLKGSAGIVGIKPLSDLAHRVEDLLDYLAEKEIEGNEKIFELLLASTDCLGSLSGGDTSPALMKRIGGVYGNFDETLTALQNGTFVTEKKEEFIAAPVRVKAAAVPEEKAPEPAQNQTAGGPKSVVRVSLEKLDELVRLVGDLVISRSVFEQRLAEFERQVSEMQHTTGRLLRATGKLETEFEASMLEVSNARFQIPGQPKPIMLQPGAAAKFDSLEFDRYTEFHQTTRELLETASDNLSINTELDNLRTNLELLFDNQSNLIEEMHDKLLRLRMVKFGSLSSRLQRTVRVTCEQEGKEADLIIEGEDTEVDTQILDLLVEPLLHLLRNAVAHGIESPDTRRLLGKPEAGRIYLRLHSEGTHVIMSVTDDGRGISAVALREKAVRNGFISQAEADRLSEQEAFSLGFLPGITTAESISQTSGRGVGMNIVKTSVARGQGTIAISSEPQKGATFTIRMPMALAITRGLLVKVSGRTFAFPLKLVKQVTEISSEEFSQLADKTAMVIGGTKYSISNLSELLNLPVHESKKDYIPLILLETLDSPAALTVDEIIRAEEVVIKPLTAPLRNYPNLLGATILGDGNVVPVLDLIFLLKERGTTLKFLAEPEKDVTAALTDADSSLDDEETVETEPETLQVMIVDDSPSVRHITSKLIKNAGWDVVLAKDGQEALDLLLDAEKLPNVILSDVEMPRLDGYELLTAIRNSEKFGHLPVIMITSRASHKHQQKAVELGVSEYLTKPFDDAVLIERIKELTSDE